MSCIYIRVEGGYGSTSNAWGKEVVRAVMFPHLLQVGERKGSREMR